MKLHLHVKTEYFNQIKAGTKTEEYRLINDYWAKRLGPQPNGGLRDYDSVVIYNAYKGGVENRMEFPWRGWASKRIIHPHFGPEEVSVYAITLKP